MRKDVHRFISQYSIYQQTKYETKKVAGLLQSLPIPSGIWEDISWISLSVCHFHMVHLYFSSGWPFLQRGSLRRTATTPFGLQGRNFVYGHRLQAPRIPTDSHKASCLIGIPFSLALFGASYFTWVAPNSDLALLITQKQMAKQKSSIRPWNNTSTHLSIIANHYGPIFRLWRNEVIIPPPTPVLVCHHLK